MCKSLLDLIATNKREEDKTKILYPLSEAIIDNDSQYALDGFYEQADIPFNGNPVAYSPNPLDIGATYLADRFDLNVHIPQQFAVQSVDLGDINVIDMPSISDVSEGFYRDIIGCNFYANQDYDFIGMEPCPPFEEQEESYLEYVRKLQTNQSIFDLFTIFSGQKVSDTKIGLIGAEALNEQFKLNLEQNAVQSVSEYLQTDPFKLITNGTLRRVPYDISVPRTNIGKTVAFVQKLTGGQFPLSYLPNDAFNINNEAGESVTDSQEYYRNILNYTGAGQKQALQDHLNRNNFRPTIPDDDYAVKGSEYLYVGPNAPKPFTKKFNAENTFSRVYYYNPRYNITQHKRNYYNDDLFSPPEDLYLGEDETIESAVWRKYDSQYDTKENSFYKNSLLGKTKDLVNETGDVPVGNGQFLDTTLKEFNVIDDGEDTIISRGDSVTAFGDWPSNPEDRLEYEVKAGDFFRVWTKDRKYSKLNRAISHRGLDRKIPSVLKDNGLLNFAPTFRSSTGISMRRYMFSIENLAWADHVGELPDCERGPGDVLTGKSGRIMWFPPYNLSFDENVTVDWNQHNFIGRGEPIYTYNNTTRTGNLKFSMIVDHPMIVNKIRAQRTEIWERYFKGDKSVFDIIEDTLYSRLTEYEITEIKKAKSKQPDVKASNDPVVPAKQKEEKKIDQDTVRQTQTPQKFFISIYFPNNVADVPVKNGVITLNPGYQSEFQPAELDYTYYKGVKRTAKFNPPYANRTNYEVNNNFFSDQYFKMKLEELLEEASENGYTKIYFDFVGNSSKADPLDISNYDLAEKRARNAKNWFDNKFDSISKQYFDISGLEFNTEAVFGLSDQESITTEDTPRDERNAVNERRVDILYYFLLPEEEPTPDDDTVDDVIADDNLNQDQDDSDPTVADDLTPDVLGKLFAITECDMFEYMEVYEPHSYKTISEKIKFFHPAFHSMTPEGFNGRLNFLHQCTRQGTNIGTETIDFTTNLAFGRPPVCILRIGDFFHTKIVINSMTITYDSAGQVKWDLNPEGFVAPMIADITLGISFIGGQALTAPINRLQNAMSYNFYASMNMFEPRADSVEATSYNIDTQIGDKWAVVEGIKLNTTGKANQYKIDPVTLDDNRMKRIGDTLKQGMEPLAPLPQVNSVVQSLEKRQPNIADLKAALKLPLTSQEKTRTTTFD